MNAIEESKLEEEQDQESNSEIQSSLESQGNKETSRASVLGRRRKKKVFADYYYGDDIFSKPKNGNKKKNKERKHKQEKQKIKTKKESGKKVSEAKQKISQNKSKDNLSDKSTSSRIKPAPIGSFSSLGSLNGLVTLNQLAAKTNELNGGSLATDLMQQNTLLKNSNGPIKPIPQRQNGSNLNYLLNAFKMSTSNKPNQLGSREDAYKGLENNALDKTIQNLLSGTDGKQLNGAQGSSMGNFQQTLSALMNLNKDSNALNMTKVSTSSAQPSLDGRRSSSEFEDNLKQSASSKARAKRGHYSKYGRDEYSTPQDRLRKNEQSLTKKQKGTHRLSKPDKNCDHHNDKIRVSKVKKNLKEGSITRLYLEPDTTTGKSGCIMIDNGSMKLEDTLPTEAVTPNLNRVLGLEAPNTTSITQKLQELLAGFQNEPYGRTKEVTRSSHQGLQSINSVPLLFHQF